MAILASKYSLNYLVKLYIPLNKFKPYFNQYYNLKKWIV